MFVVPPRPPRERAGPRHYIPLAAEFGKLEAAGRRAETMGNPSFIIDTALSMRNKYTGFQSA